MLITKNPSVNSIRRFSSENLKPYKNHNRIEHITTDPSLPLIGRTFRSMNFFNDPQMYAFYALLKHRFKLANEFNREEARRVFRSFHKSYRSDISANVVDICLCVDFMLSYM